MRKCSATFTALAESAQTIDRVTGDSAGKMYLINHYLDKETQLLGQTIPVPDVDNIDQTNSVESIGQDADNCVAQHSQNPTVSHSHFR